MRLFDPDQRIQVRTLPEIIRELERVRLSPELQSVRLAHRRLRQSHLVNALVVEFLDRPAAEQTARIKVGVARLERLMRGEDDGRGWRREPPRS